MALYFNHRHFKFINKTKLSGNQKSELFEGSDQFGEYSSFFEQMFIQSATSTQILDRDGWCLRVNTKLCELFGVRPEHMEGRVYNIFKDAEIKRNGIDKLLAKVFREKQTVTWDVHFDIGNAADSQNISVKARKKAWYSNKAYPIVNRNCELMYVIIQHEDVSERFLSADALKQSENLFRTTFENAQTGVCITGKDGRFIRANSKFSDMLGYSEEELMARKFNDITFPPDKEIGMSYLQQMISGKINNASFEKRYLHKNGRIIWVYISVGLVRDEESLPQYFISHLQDITEQKMAQEELVKAKKDAEKSDQLKSEFLAQMSHEIRSPINTMLNFISLIREEIPRPLTEEAAFSFDAIDSSSRRLIRTIDLILNMSQVQTGYLECNYRELDLHKDILKNSIKEYSKAAKLKGLELISCNEAEPCRITGDTYTLTQIFSNLIDNAIKYTKSGSITVRTYIDDGEKLNVDITDTGIGISKQYIEHIFTPFSQEEQGYTRKFEGNGLGLALVKKYCELNSAEISVKSRKGKGTTFTVTFSSCNGKQTGNQ